MASMSVSNIISMNFRDGNFYQYKDTKLFEKVFKALEVMIIKH